MTALRLLAVLNLLSRSDAERKSLIISVAARYEPARLHPQKYARIIKKCGAERRAPCTDGLLTHFVSPRGEKSGLTELHPKGYGQGIASTTGLA